MSNLSKKEQEFLDIHDMVDDLVTAIDRAQSRVYEMAPSIDLTKRDALSAKLFDAKSLLQKMMIDLSKDEDFPNFN